MKKPRHYPRPARCYPERSDVENNRLKMPPAEFLAWYIAAFCKVNNLKT